MNDLQPIEMIYSNDEDSINSRPHWNDLQYPVSGELNIHSSLFPPLSDKASRTQTLGKRGFFDLQSCSNRSYRTFEDTYFRVFKAMTAIFSGDLLSVISPWHPEACGSLWVPSSWHHELLHREAANSWAFSEKRPGFLSQKPLMIINNSE